jgi:hypothetical protein
MRGMGQGGEGAGDLAETALQRSTVDGLEWIMMPEDNI